MRRSWGPIAALACLAHVPALAAPTDGTATARGDPIALADGIGRTCLAALGERPFGLEIVKTSGLNVLCVRGKVGLDDKEIRASDFVQMARTIKGRVDGLFLTSPGGQADPWLEFAETLGQVEFVIVGGYCVSGCADYGFILGREKIVLPGSFVGWHGGPTTNLASFRRLTSKKPSRNSANPLIVGEIVGPRPRNPVGRFVFDSNTRERFLKLGQRTERLYERLGISPKILEVSAGARPAASSVATLHSKYRPDAIETWLLLFTPEVLERCYGFKGLKHMWHPGDAKQTLEFGQRFPKPSGFVTLPADVDADGCPAEPSET